MPYEREDQEVYERNTTHVVARAVAAERERCAKIARSLISTDTEWDTSYWNQACERIALKIEE